MYVNMLEGGKKSHPVRFCPHEFKYFLLLFDFKNTQHLALISDRKLYANTNISLQIFRAQIKRRFQI